MELATLRAFVETDLADASLQALLDAAEEDMRGALGPDATMVEERYMSGERYFNLARPTKVVSSITETDASGASTTLAVSDYRIEQERMRLERLDLSTSANPKSGWAGQVKVTYVPNDLARRNRALVQLVQLEVDFRPGSKSESNGDHSRTSQDYDAERDRIIAAAQSRWFA
jgi:hypothetical protein